MRWRLYTFFLSVTAVFCFMLLTAVTDYGSHGRPASLASMAVESTQLLSSHIPVAAPVVEKPAPVSARETAHFDAHLRPEPLLFFVPRDADPLLDRHEAERPVHAKAPSPRNGKVRHHFDEFGWYREETALVTAYCPCAKCCGTQSPGITSTGQNAWVPGLAADPLYLDYGTRVYIPDYGHSVVDDTGGAMRRHWRRDGILHIDVRMTYHYEARQWGKKYIKVKIYDND